MPLKIVRDNIINMETEAVVNTANRDPVVGPGCDSEIYNAAGYDELLNFRIKNIGSVPEGQVFITPGFNLKAKFIIHAVSPRYIDGKQYEEKKLRSCYKNSLALAKENNIKSIAFPLISTGSFGYPKEEGLRIAVDEINSFLADNEMLIYIVVFDEKSAELSKKFYPDLEDYINSHYVEEKIAYSYKPRVKKSRRRIDADRFLESPKKIISESVEELAPKKIKESDIDDIDYYIDEPEKELSDASPDYFDEEIDFGQLDERLRHISDTFSQYLIFLIENKHLRETDVYKNAIIDRRIFSKIKNNIDYHPQKLTALCLCIGAKLNIDEAKDLLARAGYAFSPSDITDVIFSFFIEKEIYDMIEIDIQLEEHGLPCIIS